MGMASLNDYEDYLGYNFADKSFETHISVEKGITLLPFDIEINVFVN